MYLVLLKKLLNRIFNIVTPKVPVVPRVSIFNRLTEKESAPRTWAEDDLRVMIDRAVASKIIAQMPRELAMRSLGSRMGPRSLKGLWTPLHRRNFICQSLVCMMEN